MSSGKSDKWLQRDTQDLYVKGRLPVVNCKPWGVWCLVDTGSDSSVVTSGALKGIEKGAKIEPCKCKLVTVGGDKPLLGEARVNLRGLIGRDLMTGVHVVDKINDRYQVIIGTDILEKVEGYPKLRRGIWKVRLGRKRYNAEWENETGTVVNVANVRVTRETHECLLKRLKQQYAGCFYNKGEPLSATGRVEHHIELIGEKPVFVKPRRYPFAMRNIIKNQLEEMLEEGIIRKSMSPFCSPLWVVPKKPGEDGGKQFRVVVDFRELNKRTVPEKYPLPRLEDMLDRMNGAKWFSVIDLKSGYHQIRMATADVPKTAFSFERGHYEFLRMPFGLRNAPSTFQRLMDEFLEGLDERTVQVYMDDVVVFSKTWDEHIGHLTGLFDRFKKFGLKVSPEKTKLGEREVKFMGHIVSEAGVRPNEERVKAIKEIPVPKNVKEIRTFLGMMGYYRRFISNFADITEPLTAMLKKGERVKVTPATMESVAKCKTALCSAPVLRFPNFGRPFVITSDASAEALGAVLSQVDEAGDRPVAFASKKLTPAERRYSTIERELLGVVWAVEQFRPYVYGTNFQIRTDHMPLLWVEKLKETSARITKWKERLAAYTFTIHHTKGCDNVVADCLSRNINAVDREQPEPFALSYFRNWAESGADIAAAEPANREPDIEVRGPVVIEGTEELRDPNERQLTRDPGMINSKANQLIWKVKSQPGWESTFKKYGHTKTITITVGRNISNHEIRELSDQIIRPGKLYYMFIKDPELENKISDLFKRREIGMNSELVMCDRMVETIEDPREQTAIIQRYHVGKTNHRGINETVNQLQRNYYWLSMTRTISEVLADCDICRAAKYDRSPQQAPQILTEKFDRPLQTVYADIFHFEKNKYLSIIDGFTRAAYMHRIKSKGANDVIKAIMKYFGIYGIPQKICVDKGREFDNNKLKTLAEQYGVGVHFSTTGHHNSQSLVERLHSTITEHLHLLKVDKGLTTTQAMPRAVIAYNHTVHTTTKAAPLDLMIAGRVGGDKYREIAERVQRDKTNRIEKFNRSREGNKKDEIKVGTKVFKRNFYKRNKGDIRFVGPYKVTKLLSRNRVTIQRTTDPRGRAEVIHLNELKTPVKQTRREDRA